MGLAPALRPAAEWPLGCGVGCEWEQAVDQVPARSSSSGVTCSSAAATPGSVRDVPIPAMVAAALSDHMARFPKDGELVITFKRATCSQAFAAAVTSAGHGGVKLHDLRHSYASHLLGAGVAVPTVSRLLGQDSPAITMTTYAHVIPGSEDVALAVIERVMGAESAESPQSSGHNDLTAGHRRSLDWLVRGAESDGDQHKHRNPYPST
jgi:hypothetical protein